MIGVCPIGMLKIDQNCRTSFMDVPFPKHFRSLVSTIISRNTKSVNHLLEKFSKYRKNSIRLHKMDSIKTNMYLFTYLSFELFSKVDLLLGLQSWIWVARIFFYLSSYFQCFFLPLWYLANIMCENLSPSWSEIRVETYQYFSMKADIHIVNSKIKSKNLCQSIRKKGYLTLVHIKKNKQKL